MLLIRTVQICEIVKLVVQEVSHQDFKLHLSAARPGKNHHRTAGMAIAAVLQGLDGSVRLRPNSTSSCSWQIGKCGEFGLPTARSLTIMAVSTDGTIKFRTCISTFHDQFDDQSILPGQYQNCALPFLGIQVSTGQGGL